MIAQVAGLEVYNHCRYTLHFVNIQISVFMKKQLYKRHCIGQREAWFMRSAERRKMNVLEMKRLRNWVGMKRMDIQLIMNICLEKLE